MLNNVCYILSVTTYTYADVTTVWVQGNVDLYGYSSSDMTSIQMSSNAGIYLVSESDPNDKLANLWPTLNSVKNEKILGSKVIYLGTEDMYEKSNWGLGDTPSISNNYNYFKIVDNNDIPNGFYVTLNLSISIGGSSPYEIVGPKYLNDEVARIHVCTRRSK